MKTDLLNAMKGKKGEAAYNAYKHVICEMEETCREAALAMVASSPGSQQAKNTQKTNIEKKYQESIKNYPAQQRQAILDGQDFGPIAQNGATGANAMCDEMITFASDSY